MSAIINSQENINKFFVGIKCFQNRGPSLSFSSCRRLLEKIENLRLNFSTLHAISISRYPAVKAFDSTKVNIRNNLAAAVIQKTYRAEKKIQGAMEEVCGKQEGPYTPINHSRSSVLMDVCRGKISIPKEEEEKVEKKSPTSVFSPILYQAPRSTSFTDPTITYMHNLALEIIIRNGAGAKFPNLRQKKNFNHWQTGALVRKLFWNLENLSYADQIKFRASEIGRFVITMVGNYKKNRSY